MGFERRRGFRPKPPVKEGETYEITIEGIGTKGDGVGRVKGFVVIVPGVKKGDRVMVKITAVRGKVAFAQLESKVSTSSDTQAGEEEQSAGEMQENGTGEEPSEESEDYEDEEDFDESDADFEEER